jgi:hypothetical protein
MGGMHMNIRETCTRYLLGLISGRGKMKETRWEDQWWCGGKSSVCELVRDDLGETSNLINN